MMHLDSLCNSWYCLTSLKSSHDSIYNLRCKLSTHFWQFVVVEMVEMVEMQCIARRTNFCVVQCSSFTVACKRLVHRLNELHRTTQKFVRHAMHHISTISTISTTTNCQKWVESLHLRLYIKLWLDLRLVRQYQLLQRLSRCIIRPSTSFN